MDAACIVAVGDSITQGAVPHKSWRYWLWRELLDAGVTFTWAGSTIRRLDEQEDEELLRYGNLTFPARHEGHWGWRADQILEEIPTWAIGYQCQPSCALVHLGTNDMWQGDDLASTVDEVLRVPEVLRRLGNPNMTVLLAVPIPSCTERVSTELAPRIRALGDDGPGRRFLVHQDVGFSNVSMTYDGCHPNELGEQAMAARWRDAVLEHCVNVTLAVGVQLPPPMPHVQPPSPPALPPGSIVAVAAAATLALGVVVACAVRWRRRRRRRLEKHTTRRQKSTEAELSPMQASNTVNDQ